MRSTSLRRLVTVVAALLPLALLPGVASATMAAPGPARGAPTGPILPVAAPLPPARQIYVLGDSLTVGTLVYGDPGYLRTAATAARLALQPAPSAKVGRTVAEGLAILRARNDLPGTVLVALGTNDWTSSAAEASSWVRAVRAAVGPDVTLYWVNLSMSGRTYAPSVVRINQGLLDGVRADNARQQRDGRDGASRVLDWRSFAVDHRVVNGRDGVHYPLTGYRQRAAFYVGAVTDAEGFADYVLA